MSHNEEVCDLMERVSQEKDYRDRIEGPIMELCTAMWAVDFQYDGLDHEIVSVAAKKIRLLQNMLLACGIKEGILKAIMEDA